MSARETRRMPAYAKINTYLAVTGVRPNGYHTLLSHMQAVSLQDTLTLYWQRGEGDRIEIRLSCDRPDVPTDEHNLICRAARALFEALADTGRAHSGSLEVHLEKRIPMAAGLGGGSADAAATLCGLNDLLGHPFSTDALCEIGVKLGADIPFCVRSIVGGGASMTARGIGEMLETAPGLLPTWHLVVACHGEGVSTPWAYRRLDEEGVVDVNAEASYHAFLSALISGAPAQIAEASYNCFERVVLPARSAVQDLMDAMTQAGATLVRMSGSGPSVFGVFEWESDAQKCLEALKQKGILAHLCRPL